MKLKKCFFLLLAVIPLVPYSASALLMRESGPEPIIVQIKESLRQSDDLDAELAKLADLQRESSLRVEKRWAGPKFLEMISFPKNFTEEEALAVIAKLQQLPAVEKVVASPPIISNSAREIFRGSSRETRQSPTSRGVGSTMIATLAVHTVRPTSRRR